MKFFDTNPEKEMIYAEESHAFNAAEFIVFHMKRRKFDALELAICAHVSPWKFSRFLKGRGDLKVRELARVLHTLGCTVTWNYAASEPEPCFICGPDNWTTAVCDTCLAENDREGNDHE